MKLGAQITGIKEVRVELARIGTVSNQALKLTAEDIEAFAAKEAGKHTKTGALVASTYLRREGADFVVGHDRQRARYAEWVHWGAPAHDIKPKGKKALRWAGGGVYHFAKIVHHPGNKPDPWMTRAAALAPREFEQHVQALLAEKG